MSRHAQLYWPVDLALPVGTRIASRALFKRKQSFLTKFLPSTRKFERELLALQAAWAEVFDNLSKLYDDAAPTLNGDSLGRWLSAIDYRIALSSSEVRLLGIEALMTVAVWDNIEDDGEFPEDQDWWASPEDVERACESLIELTEAGNETALKAREIYIKGGLPENDPRFGDDAWRKEREVGFLAELRRIIENAVKCRERGITKVGFLIFM